MLTAKILSDRPLAVAPAGDVNASTNSDTSALWSLLGWVGVSLVLVDLLDLALTWYPPNFGNPEWEFGSVTSTLNGIPVLAVGMGLILGMAVTGRRRWLVRTMAVAFALTALAILVLAALWGTTVPIALQSIPADNPVLTGLKKAVVKTAGQAIVFPAVFLVIAIRSWRFSGQMRARAKSSAA